MGIVLAKVVFGTTTGLVADEIVHDFTFRWDGPTGPTEGELNELQVLLAQFYNTDPGPSTRALSAYLSLDVLRTANSARMLFYRVDVLGEDAGSPDLVVDWTPGAAPAGVRSLPSEIAVVLSLSADTTNVPERVGNTRPASRRRGRLFFGPLNDLALSLAADATGVQRPSDAIQDDLRTAADALENDSKNVMNLNAGLFWSVYSTVDNAARNIVKVSTDDAFDVQRRRGPDATARQITSVV